MHQYLLIAIILFIVSIVFFSLILFVFFKNKELKVKETQLKKEWNDLSLYNFEKTNLPIEHISFIDEKFEKIMFLFNDFANEYKESLVVIKQGIYKLPKTLTNYDWKSFKTIHDMISLEIKLLKSSLSSLSKMQQNILAYKDYISYILVAYRENTWKLIEFYKNNLLDYKCDSNFVKLSKKYIENLRSKTEELNTCIENYDINVTVSAINEMNKAFVSLLETVEKMYIKKRHLNYIDYSINEVKNILNSNYRSIQSNLVLEVEKQYSKIDKNYQLLKYKSHSQTEEENNRLRVSLIKSLRKIKQDLNISFKLSKFFNQNKPLIDKSFNGIVSIIPEINKTMDKHYNNFIEDREIKTEILKCNSNFTTINTKIKEYEKLTSKNNYDPQNLLELARSTIELIVHNTYITEQILANINTKYESSKKVLNSITSNKLLLAQMKAYIFKNKLTDNNYVQIIDKLFNDLNNIEKNFVSKKRDLNYWVTLIAEVNSEISSIEKDLININSLKLYVEKIVSYASLKMALDPSLSYRFDRTIELYNQGNFKDGALLMLSQIKK